MIELFIPIEPIGKGRPRFGRNFTARTPEKTRVYELAVYAHAKRHAMENNIACCYGPMAASLTFYLPRPKSHTKKQRENKWHTTTPDTDNMVKAVLDAINGIFYKDDSQVCEVHAVKVYADGQEPGTLLRLAKL